MGPLDHAVTILRERLARLAAGAARAAGVPSRQIAAVAVMVGAAIVVTFAYDQMANHERAMAQAERDTRNAAQLLAEHAARTFERVEETLLAVGRLRADVARGIYRSQASIFVHLNSLRGSSSVLDEIGWLNDYGERAATSRLVDPPRLNFTDRDFFRIHREGRADGVYLSAPTDHRGVRYIDVSLRLNNLDGRFAGVAYGMVDPRQFANIYEALELGAGQRVELLRGDGTILAQAPAREGTTGSLADSALFREHLPAAASGGYTMRSPVDQVVRIGSYATVRHTRGQLVINVSVPRSSVEAAFYAELRRRASQTGLLLLALLAVSWLLIAGLRRRERLQAELTAATATANAARAGAEAANRAKSAFLARMSHELRTPLNAVIGFAQMLELDRPQTLNETQREYCRYIISGGEHLLKLVNEVLDLSGVEAGRLVLAPEHVRVADMLTQVGESMSPLAARAGVTLDLLPPAGVADVIADPLRLRQVLINLVANAIKYNRPDGSVTIAAAMTDGRVRFTITDTGLGIAPDRHAKLFEPFSRGGSSYTAVEGTGLGLALSKRLVDAMGGTIGFTSQLGEGTRFWFDLPAVDSFAKRPAGVEASPATAARPRATLLYVEDDPANLRRMEHLLARRSDIAMLSAPRPRQALELAVAHRPDVILVDVGPSGVEGDQFVRRLKAMPETRAIPVLALTAAPPGEVEPGRPEGDIFCCLRKPVDPKALMAALDAAIAA